MTINNKAVAVATGSVAVAVFGFFGIKKIRKDRRLKAAMKSATAPTE